MTDGTGMWRIYWVGVGKGGVGKSMMTLATLDHLLEQGAHVPPVECDTPKPDVCEGVEGAGPRRPKCYEVTLALLFVA